MSVLYSRKDAVWKLADFGLTSEAAVTWTTSKSRGTEGYRAPELLLSLQGKKAIYNNKVDIWSIGCILFELAVCQKAFFNDWATLHYQSSSEALDIPLDESFSEQCKETINRNIRSILALTSSSRPSAADLETEFVKNFKSNQALAHTAVHVHQIFHQVEAISIDGDK
jgi:serine/threonine protein kinase